MEKERSGSEIEKGGEKGVWAEIRPGGRGERDGFPFPELLATTQRTSGPHRGFPQLPGLSNLSLTVRPGTSGVTDVANTPLKYLGPPHSSHGYVNWGQWIGNS